MRYDRRSRERLQGRVLLLVIVVLVALALFAGTGADGAQVVSPQASPAGAEGPCLGDDDPYDLEGLRQILDDPNPPRGLQTINPYLTVEFVGQEALMDGQPAFPTLEVEDPASDGEGEPPADEADYRVIELQAFNTTTENVFHLVAQQEMLDDVLDCHQSEGRTSATEGRDDAEGEDQLTWLPAILRNGTPDPVGPRAPDGWSNGIDTRIMRTATTSWPWRTISQFRYGSVDESRCTGTLIGPRHLVTAAHCINDQGTNTWFTIRVAPGKNGVGNEPYGESVISTNPAPGTSAWYFTPWQWRDPNVTHWQWDWGLIVIPDRLGDMTGWMGYVALSGNYLKTVANYNRGYPLCGTANDPASCQDARFMRHERRAQRQRRL